jgi:hypothetical protein
MVLNGPEWAGVQLFFASVAENGLRVYLIVRNCPMSHRSRLSHSTAGTGVLLFFSLLILALGLAPPVSAQEIGTRGNFKPSAEDLAFLPPYCRARVMSGSPEARQWSRLLQGGWNHIHHYCHALKHLNDLNTSFSLTDRERRFRLQRVVAEIEYVEKRVDPSFPLWNEMMMHKAQAQSQLQIMNIGR